MQKRNSRKLQQPITCLVTRRKRNCMTSSAMRHLKKAAEQDMVPEALTSQVLTVLVSVVLAALEKARAVLTEARTAAIRNTILKAVTWTTF